MNSGFHQALEGVLVVALEQAVAAPYCTSRLADAGARVIKIERPGGDFARGYDTAASGESAYFVWLNRGKESVCLDLKQPSELALLQRLLSQADVFVQNLAPGAADRLGIDAADLAEVNPGLIRVDITGYGSSEAYSRMKAYDLLVQCESGLASITGSPDAPGRVGVSICDIACGMYAQTAVLQALIARGRTGKGCRIGVSLFDAIADWMAVPLLQYEGGLETRRMGLNHPTIAPYGAYACGDGELLVFSIQNEREWERLCRDALGQVELLEDANFATNEARLAHRGELDGHLDARLGTQPRAYWVEKFSAASLAFGSVQSLPALGSHPALRRQDQPLDGASVSMVSPPAEIEGQKGPQLGPVPALDDHGRQIRAEFG